VEYFSEIHGKKKENRLVLKKITFIAGNG